ncbi:MAG: hypothetical protein ACRC0A_03965 [Chitinophagaceae bacterium]
MYSLFYKLLMCMISIGKVVRFIESSKMFLIHHFLMNKNILLNNFPFYIESYPNQYIPYFVEFSRKRSEDILEIKVQENLSMQVDKEKFLLKEIYLQEKDFLQYAGFYSPLRYLDFQVMDRKENIMGVFKSIFEYQNKWCLRIYSLENKEIFIYLPNKRIEEIFEIKSPEKKLVLL